MQPTKKQPTKKMRDSGARETSTRGGQREPSPDKPDLHLISPFAMYRLGHWLRLGAHKHGDRNWESGMPFSWCVASLKRHLEQYLMGDREEDHLSAIVCRGMFLLHYEELIARGLLPAELDDLPHYLDRAPTPSPDSKPLGSCPDGQFHPQDYQIALRFQHRISRTGPCWVCGEPIHQGEPIALIRPKLTDELYAVHPSCCHDVPNPENLP